MKPSRTLVSEEGKECRVGLDGQTVHTPEGAEAHFSREQGYYTVGGTTDEAGRAVDCAAWGSQVPGYQRGHPTHRLDHLSDWNFRARDL